MLEDGVFGDLSYFGYEVDREFSPDDSGGTKRRVRLV